MKRLFTLLLCVSSLVVVGKPKAAKVVDSTKVNVKFGGRVDVMAYYDSYNSVEARNGAQYMFPKAPMFNSFGQDLNFEDKLRFSIATTRLNVTLNVPKIGKATGKAFVEADFMGVNESVLGAIRLRHAYFSIDWKKQSLLMGQTSHLLMIDDIAPNIVTFGGGYPLNTLNRAIQFRFTQRFWQKSSVDVAVAMLAGADYKMQANAIAPDLHVRLNFGTGKSLFGVAGGFKVLKPRNITADSSRATKSFFCFDAAVYYKGDFNKHTIALYAVWGQDANALGVIGGFGPLYKDINSGVKDYGYAPTSAISVWADYQSPKWNGFFVGLFAGWQQNLGSIKEIDIKNATIPNFGVDHFFRIAPKVMFDYKMLTFGLEYMYTQAQWAKEMNKFYTPTKLYDPTANHRVTLLARFRF